MFCPTRFSLGTGANLMRRLGSGKQPMPEVLERQAKHRNPTRGAKMEFRCSRRAVALAAISGFVALGACGGSRGGPSPTGSVPAPEPILSTAAPGRVPRQPDAVALYRRMGL